MPDLKLTDWLAIWGAALSSVLAFLKINEYRRDRPIVKVRISPGMKAFPAMTAYGDMMLLSVTVANAGRRPVSITHVALLARQPSTYILCTDTLSATYPVELTEGKHHSFIFNEDELKRQYKLDERDYIVCATDSTGREHWSHGRLRRLWRLGRLR